MVLQNKKLSGTGTYRGYRAGWLWMGAALLALGSAAPALAQVAPTREEILRTPPPVSSETTRVDIDSNGAIERSPCPLSGGEFTNVRFTLSQVTFNAPAALDTAMLDDAWRDMVGQEVPVASVCEIRDRAATILRRAGYLAAVRVPVQTISGGAVQLDILAAHLSRIQVRGDIGANEHQLARYLSNLQDQPLFNVRDAERSLLLANNIPGLSTRLTLRPAGAPGEVVGEVIAVQQAGAVDANFQNFGSHAVGRWGGIARARLFGLTGLGDETSLAIYSTADTDEQQVVQAGHNFRLGRHGLTIAGDFTYAWTRPTIAGGLNLKSNTLVGTLQARYPINLRQTRSTWIAGGFDWIDQDTSAVGALLSRDNLRVAWLKLDQAWIDPDAFSGVDGYSPAEPQWSANLELEARKGIDIFGASDRCVVGGACFGPGAVPLSRIEANPSAFIVRARGEFAFRPTPIVTFVVAPRAQYSSSALAAYEEFSAGNFTTGRGYDPGILTGDSGLGLSGEIRILSLVPRTRTSFAIQPFAFVDAAWTWNEDSGFAGLNPQKLVSVGGGARVAWGDRARLDFAIAEPLQRAGFAGTRGPTRFLMSLSVQFGIAR